MTLVYLDTVITSGHVLKDLTPLAEMEAVELIYRLDSEGRIKIVTSNVGRQEQGRATRPDIRDALAAHANDVPRVTNDHRLLGFSNLDYGNRGFISSPIISDIVDEDLYARLHATGLANADARHVMNAFVNNCQFFVTLDWNDILPRRAAAEAICTPMSIVTPTELVAMLPME